jgi:hypothetical protein
MTEARTQASTASVDEYLQSRASGPLLADAQALLTLMRRVSAEPAVMWGPSIVGFGRYRYPLAGGKTGEACRTGFAIRGRELVVYLIAEGAEQQALLERLGPHRMGKACLYFKGLAKVDPEVLETLIRESLAELARRFPD